MKTPEEVLAYMKLSTSTVDWNKRCTDVKEAFDGHYPAFWWSTMIQSGEADKILATLGGDTKIRVV
jgi:hypothetical protein